MTAPRQTSEPPRDAGSPAAEPAGMKPYTATVRGQQIVVDEHLMHRAPVHLPEGDVARATLGLKAFRLVLQLIFRLLFRIRVEGRQNIPSGPAIICFNHLG